MGGSDRQARITATVNKSSSAKPILVVRFPKRSGNIDKIISQWKEQMPDYHLIFILDGNISRIEFECLNPSSSEKNLEELTESLKSNTEENKVKEKAEIKPL